MHMHVPQYMTIHVSIRTAGTHYNTLLTLRIYSHSFPFPGYIRLQVPLYLPHLGFTYLDMITYANFASHNKKTTQTIIHFNPYFSSQLDKLQITTTLAQRIHITDGFRHTLPLRTTATTTTQWPPSHLPLLQHSLVEPTPSITRLMLDKLFMPLPPLLSHIVSKEENLLSLPFSKPFAIVD